MMCDECVRHPPEWRRGAAVFRYQGVGRKLMLALKHGDRLDTVPMLAGWMLNAGKHLVHGADLIAPVPLHWSRLLKRRYNQASELAREVARHSGKPESFFPELLRRSRRTKSQDGKDRDARAANLLDAIEVKQRKSIAGKRVLLIDDVLTTGATLNAAARACRAAGATSIDILVLALVVHDSVDYLKGSDEEPDA